MASQYHISKNGEPGVCHATIGGCPLGGESGAEDHFNSPEECYAGIAEKEIKKNGMFSTSVKNTSFKSPYFYASGPSDYIKDKKFTPDSKKISSFGMKSQISQDFDKLTVKSGLGFDFSSSMKAFEVKV